MRNPDWTTLPTDLVARISGLLISDDVSDFVRLRTVCHPWRSSTVEMKNADLSCPGNWIMLSNPKSSLTDVCFFNTSTHKCFSFDLTPYLDTYSLFRAFDCLFLLKHKITQGFALLNPFMRSLIPLPSKIESNCANAPLKLEDLISKQSFDLSGVFVSSSSNIVLGFTSMDYLLWTKPGDRSWLYAGYKENKVQCFSNVLFYKDRLLTIDDDKGLVQINLANEMPSQSQVEVVIPSSKLLADLDAALYLVDCGGEIILQTQYTYASSTSVILHA
ncbi:hypothetical protein LUZ62_037255 [Rhynchospora pubera]|uniref:KIB1-4 beta-propeller domain-containing protein n=1 Tax=Rhynchospora pubera TaxID=906938 RepID=A0AAV8F358_9POAL|nr:hypothetical protein LUZ62_037255 [Rhynchospora pubera]